MKNYKVLYCDLDGTLIEPISGAKFPKGVWDMKLKFDVLEAIKKLAPDYVFIISNQGGIEKGFVDRYHFTNKIRYVGICIKEYCNIGIVDWYYCASNDPNNNRRKPNTDMLMEALENHNFPTAKVNILMIGDASGLNGQFSDSDKKTAENFGIDYMDISEFVKCMQDEATSI